MRLSSIEEKDNNKVAFLILGQLQHTGLEVPCQQSLPGSDPLSSPIDSTLSSSCYSP